MDDDIKYSDYQRMGTGAPSRGQVVRVDGLDDPNLSQEEKDHRLALALQQQENAAVYDLAKKKHDAAVAAQANRTTRSNVATSLATIRKKQKENGEAAEYASGSGSADEQYAAELQRMENAGASAMQTLDYMIKEVQQDKEADDLRTSHSRSYNVKK
jgi:hypothetical protein